MSVEKKKLIGKRVLILQQRGWALRVGHPLAVALVRGEGAIVGAVTIKPSTHEYIKNQTDIEYDQIISADAMKNDPSSMKGLETTTLADVCEGLGIDTVWRIVQASRSHVTSYEDRFYYSFRQGLPDQGIKDFIIGTYLHVKRCFDDFRPDVMILPFFSGLQHIMFSMLAEKRGIILLGGIDSKVRGVLVLARNYLAQESDYLDRVKELKEGAASTNLNKARAYLEKNRVSLAANDYGISTNASIEREQEGAALFIPGPKTGLRSYLRAFYECVIESREFYRHHHREYIKATGVTVDFRPPKTIFRDKFTMLKYKKDTEQYDGYSDLTKLQNIVYFPLQTQPEATINIHAAEFTNQIETARQVAMSLPDDYCLVVKDHPAMAGRRSMSYLDKIARLPNVKLIDVRVSTEQVLSRTKLLVSPSSSTLSEAALLRVPAIQLGSLGTTKNYPNVTHHSNLMSLPKVIRELLARKVDPDLYDEELLKYIAAAYDVGIEDSHTQLYVGDVDEEEKRVLEKKVSGWFVNEICNRLEKVS